MRVCSIWLCALALLSAPLALAGNGDHAEKAQPAGAEAPKLLEAQPLSGGISVLYGEGGNIGVFAGKDAVFLIDDKFTHSTAQVSRAVAALSDKPVKFLINTHYHFDHAGGNTFFGEQGAVIVAHDNVRKRLSVDQFMKAFNKTTPATPTAGLPVITFADNMTLHLDGHTITAQYFPNAHTDGDAAVFFKEENIVHTGDLLFNGIYPFIDIEGGGSLRGLINAQTAILARIDANTIVIPGHGKITDKNGLIKTRDMLQTIYNEIAQLVLAGKTREETIAVKPTSTFDAMYGGGFLSPAVFTGIAYKSVKKTLSDTTRPDIKEEN